MACEGALVARAQVGHRRVESFSIPEYFNTYIGIVSSCRGLLHQDSANWILKSVFVKVGALASESQAKCRDLMKAVQPQH